MSEMPNISIIIPSHNDSVPLERCIQSLMVQTYPKEKLEWIVVDDGSTVGVSNWLPREFPDVKFLRKEKRTGPDDSRNRGIELAKGEILGFIDSDCIADPNWVEEGISALLKDRISIVTGRVIPGKQFRDKLIGLLEFGEFLDDKSRDIKNFVTCNLFIRKEIFNDYRFPCEVIGGGDRLLSWKLQRLGFKIRYHGKMRVFHYPDLRFRPLCRRIKTYAYKTILLRRIDPTLPGGRWIRLSILSPILFSGIKFCIDLKNFFSNLRSLGIKPLKIPLFVLCIFLMRATDLIVMETFFLKQSVPGYSGDKGDFLY